MSRSTRLALLASSSDIAFAPFFEWWPRRLLNADLPFGFSEAGWAASAKGRAERQDGRGRLGFDGIAVCSYSAGLAGALSIE
jgi:hypothetical protein